MLRCYLLFLFCIHLLLCTVYSSPSSLIKGWDSVVKSVSSGENHEVIAKDNEVKSIERGSFFPGKCFKVNCGSSVGIIPEEGCTVDYSKSEGSCDGFVTKQGCSTRWYKVPNLCSGIWNCDKNKTYYSGFGCLKRGYKSKRDNCYNC